MIVSTVVPQRPFLCWWLPTGTTPHLKRQSPPQSSSQGPYKAQETLVVKTPSGGYHLIYTYDRSMNKNINDETLKIDIKTEGGYLVGVGSIVRPTIGDNKNKWTEYVLMNDKAPSAMPEDVKTWLTQNVKAKNTNTKPKKTVVKPSFTISLPWSLCSIKSPSLTLMMLAVFFFFLVTTGALYSSADIVVSLLVYVTRSIDSFTGAKTLREELLLDPLLLDVLLLFFRVTTIGGSSFSYISFMAW